MDLEPTEALVATEVTPEAITVDTGDTEEVTGDTPAMEVMQAMEGKEIG